MLVDSSGILLFFPLLLCYFFIFFYFSISYLGLLSRRTKFPAFLSIRAFKFDIFSIIYLCKQDFTAHFEVQESHLRTKEGSMFRGCSRKLFGRERNFFAFSQYCCCFLCLFLDMAGDTHGEDVLWLIMYFFKDFFMFLSEKISHFDESFWVLMGVRSII